MAAAVYRAPHDLRVEQVPVPDVGPDDLLVEVAWCGVCGSDLHTIIEGWGRPGSIGGHEWSGTVIDAGARVEGWSPGDVVVGGAAVACGTCAMCEAGRPGLCLVRPTPGVDEYAGAFAAYKIVSAAEAIRVPDGLDLRTAALAEPLAVALHAFSQGQVQRHHRVLVTGAGPIGALVIAALGARGIGHVVVSEPSDTRRALARRLGAVDVVAPGELEVPTKFEPMRLRTDPFDVAFECSGKGVAMEAALAQLGKLGRLVLVGAGIDTPQFDPNRILLNELVITGAFEYDAGGFDEALSLLSSGAFPVAELVEPDDVALADLLETCERLFRGEIAGKVMVNPRPADTALSNRSEDQ